MKNRTRKKAITWWSFLSKEEQCLKIEKCPKFKNRFPSSLEGSEVEEIYIKENGHLNSVWTNGTYTISWLYDEVVISDNKDNYSTIQGGDFEYILQGLLKMNPRNKEDLY